MDIAIETRQLSKHFESPRGWRRASPASRTAAVREVNLEVRKGELYGLLGPNGAGKTTLVKLLCTLILPSSGSAAVAGHPLGQSGAIRSEVGLVVSDERSFYWRLSARRNLDFFAALHGLYGRDAADRINSVLSQVQLQNESERRFSSFSAGMRQRLAIARSLLHRPRILFLDEPSRSLDPAATRRLHELLLQFVAEREMTIFLITHDLAEAEKLCGRVAMMHQGQIKAIGPPDQLRRHHHPQRHYTVHLGPLASSELTDLADLAPYLRYEEADQSGRLRFRAAEGDGRIDTVLHYLHQHQLAVHAIEGASPTLEEVFNYFTDEASEDRTA